MTVDPIRPFIPRCTLTKNCKGELKLLESNDVGFADDANIADWTPRDATERAGVAEPAPRIGLYTGEGYVTVAVPAETSPPATRTLNLNKARAGSTSHRSYEYRRAAGTSRIFGVDDAAGRALVILDGESVSVSVSVNGIAVTDFSVVGDVIVLGAPLTADRNVVNVAIASAAADDAVEITLRLTVNIYTPSAVVSAWDAVDQVTLAGESYDVYVGDARGLRFGDLVTVHPTDPGIPSGSRVLLASAPMSNHDVIRDVSVPLASLAGVSMSVETVPGTDIPMIYLDESLASRRVDRITDVYPKRTERTTAGDISEVNTRLRGHTI